MIWVYLFIYVLGYGATIALLQGEVDELGLVFFSFAWPLMVILVVVLAPLALIAFAGWLPARYVKQRVAAYLNSSDDQGDSVIDYECDA